MMADQIPEGFKGCRNIRIRKQKRKDQMHFRLQGSMGAILQAQIPGAVRKQPDIPVRIPTGRKLRGCRMLITPVHDLTTGVLETVNLTVNPTTVGTPESGKQTLPGAGGYASPNGRKSIRKGMNEKQRLMTAASRKKDLITDDPAGVGKGIAGNRKKSSIEINRFWQRKRYKDAYKNTRKAGGVLTGAGEKAYGSGGIFSRALQRIRSMFGGGEKSHVLMTVAAIGVITMILAASISSCASFIQGIGAAFTGSTYPSTDEDIYLAEAAHHHSLAWTAQDSYAG